MADRRFGWILACVGVLAVIGLPRPCRAQAPTIEETGIIPRAGITTTPGSLNSLLGHVAGLERGDLRHAAGARRLVAGSDRNGGAAGSDGDHDARGRVPRAPGRAGSRRDATASGAAAAALRLARAARRMRRKRDRPTA